MANIGDVLGGVGSTLTDYAQAKEAQQLNQEAYTEHLQNRAYQKQDEDLSLAERAARLAALRQTTVQNSPEFLRLQKAEQVRQIKALGLAPEDEAMAVGFVQADLPPALLTGFFANNQKRATAKSRLFTDALNRAQKGEFSPVAFASQAKLENLSPDDTAEGIRLGLAEQQRWDEVRKRQQSEVDARDERRYAHQEAIHAQSEVAAENRAKEKEAASAASALLKQSGVTTQQAKEIESYKAMRDFLDDVKTMITAHPEWMGPLSGRIPMNLWPSRDRASFIAWVNLEAPNFKDISGAGARFWSPQELAGMRQFFEKPSDFSAVALGRLDAMSKLVSNKTRTAISSLQAQRKDLSNPFFRPLLGSDYQFVQPDSRFSSASSPGGGLSNFKVNPSTGQRIGWNGSQWVDAKTGQPVK